MAQATGAALAPGELPQAYALQRGVSSGDEEVRLYESARERSTVDDMGDLYAIIVATEHLEKAYVRDAVTAEQYESTCQRLISQFRTAEKALRQAGHISDAEQFARDFYLDCPRAVERLCRVGVPATVVHNTGAMMSQTAQSSVVAETVQYYITAMDSLKLDQRAVDEIQPLISDLVGSLTRVRGAPDGEIKSKLISWLERLNGMRAAEELSEEDARQLAFDLETTYNAFHRFLQA